MNKISQKSAFTLMELAMVLLIIGFIVSAFTTTSSIIQTANLRSIITDLNNFKVAIDSFQQAYGQLPGDYTEASTMWPTCATKTGDSGTNSDCNGNGDGVIGIAGSRGWSPTSNYTLSTSWNVTEQLRAWEHLSLAGMIPGNYTGFNINHTASTSNPGVDTPVSRYPGASYSFWGDSCYTGIARPVLIVGGMSGFNANFNPGSIAAWPILTPSDSYYIDSKMDDGTPATGIIQARTTNASTNCGGAAAALSCVNYTSLSNNSYNLANFSQVCQLQFSYYNPTTL